MREGRQGWLRSVLGRSAVRIAVKMTLTSALAYGVATAVLHVPAVAAPLVPLIVFRTPDPWTVWHGLIGRLAGVLLGVVLAVLILALSQPTWWWVAVVVAISAAIQAIPKVGTFLVNNWQIAISAVLVLGTGPGSYASERFWESVIGALVTIVVAVLVWPPDPARELAARVDRLAAAVAKDLQGAVSLVGADADAAAAAEDQVLRRLVHARETLADIPKARRSLRSGIYRWSKRNQRIDGLAVRLRRLAGAQHLVSTLVHAVVLLDADSRHLTPPLEVRARLERGVEQVAAAVTDPGGDVGPGWGADLDVRLQDALGPLVTSSDPWVQAFVVGLEALARQLATGRGS